MSRIPSPQPCLANQRIPTSTAYFERVSKAIFPSNPQNNGSTFDAAFANWVNHKRSWSQYSDYRRRLVCIVHEILADVCPALLRRTSYAEALVKEYRHANQFLCEIQFLLHRFLNSCPCQQDEDGSCDSQAEGEPSNDDKTVKQTSDLPEFTAESVPCSSDDLVGVARNLDDNLDHLSSRLRNLPSRPSRVDFTKSPTSSTPSTPCSTPPLEHTPHHHSPTHRRGPAPRMPRTPVTPHTPRGPLQRQQDAAPGTGRHTPGTRTPGTRTPGTWREMHHHAGVSPVLRALTPDECLPALKARRASMQSALSANSSARPSISSSIPLPSPVRSPSPSPYWDAEVSWTPGSGGYASSGSDKGSELLARRSLSPMTLSP